jgi:hypothetical protein
MPFSYQSKIKHAQLPEEKGHVLQLPVQNMKIYRTIISSRKLITVKPQHNKNL